jgi:hypothetical protein
MEGQVANDALPTGRSGSAANGSLSMGRFRNWKLMAIEVAVALLGFYVFVVTTADNLASPGIVGVIAGIGALWLFQCEPAGHLDRLPNANNADEAKPMDARLVVSATNYVAVRGAPIDNSSALVRV